MSQNPSPRRRLTVQEVDTLVHQYKQGVAGASEQLVGAFEGFLVKFLNLINKGEADLNDKVLRNFIDLFTKAHVHQFRHNPSVRNEVYSTIGLIKEQFSRYERDEIKNELTVVFLKMAQRYRSPQDGNPYFHTYIQKAFHWAAYKQLAILTRDPLVYGNGNMVGTFTDQDGGAVVENAGSTDEWVDSLSDAYFIDEALENDNSYLDENWVNGNTSSSKFSELTPLDRRILKMYYVDGLEDQQIADVLNVCRATVNRRRMSSEQLLYRAHSETKQFRSDDEYVDVVREKAGSKSKTDESRQKAEDEAVQRAVRRLNRWRTDG